MLSFEEFTLMLSISGKRRSYRIDHIEKDHIDIDVQIENFHPSIISKQCGSVHTRLAESLYIRLNKLQLKRKH